MTCFTTSPTRAQGGGAKMSFLAEIWLNSCVPAPAEKNAAPKNPGPRGAVLYSTPVRFFVPKTNVRLTQIRSASNRNLRLTPLRRTYYFCP
ncbi:hypothetical protein Hanom_Chr01g00001311 [Helianthus anomalus]